MSRSPVVTAILAMLLAACSDAQEQVPSAAVLVAAGDRFAREADWIEAAERYRLAFAVEDPVPERAKARAYVAYRRGLALARYGRAEDASRWFDRAERLNPDLYVVWFERGYLHDGHLPAKADAAASREAYERFIAAWQAAGEPATEAPVAEEARRRIDALDSR